jgi:RNA polymerase sigma-70 factor, ECF subfamily
MEAEEIELIQRAKTDQEAFGQLYERYADRIYNYIYYRTSNQADAEDLTARVFMRAMKHMPNFEYQGVPFSAWLYRIAHNLVANYHRDRSRRKIIALEDIIPWYADDEGPEIVAQLMEDKEHLLAAMRRLPADRQELLFLKFVERLTNAEIGDIMGRTEGAIKSLYHRTLLSLREEMARQTAVSPPETDKQEPFWIRAWRRRRR